MTIVEDKANTFATWKHWFLRAVRQASLSLGWQNALAAVSVDAEHFPQRLRMVRPV